MQNENIKTTVDIITKNGYLAGRGKNLQKVLVPQRPELRLSGSAAVCS